jgi:hypothetical protein
LYDRVQIGVALFRRLIIFARPAPQLELFDQIQFNRYPAHRRPFFPKPSVFNHHSLEQKVYRRGYRVQQTVSKSGSVQLRKPVRRRCLCRAVNPGSANRVSGVKGFLSAVGAHAPDRAPGT